MSKDAMLLAFSIIDEFERTYAPSPDGVLIVVDLVDYYPERRRYNQARADFFKAAMAYCRSEQSGNPPAPPDGTA